jgi:hypothetical protein
MCSSVGSANVNRRGFYHDGEIHLFTLPQSLRSMPGNPVKMLRRVLWATCSIFRRRRRPLMRIRSRRRTCRAVPVPGNRFTDVDAIPSHILLGQDRRL